MYKSNTTRRKLYILCCLITRLQNRGGEGALIWGGALILNSGWWERRLFEVGTYFGGGGANSRIYGSGIKILEAWIPTVKKQYCRSVTMRTYEGTVSQVRIIMRIEMHQQQRANVLQIATCNNQPHRLMKTSSVAVEMSRWTPWSDSIVRQLSKIHLSYHAPW